MFHNFFKFFYRVILNEYVLYSELYSLFILLTRRKATEALYIGKQLPWPAFEDTEILLSDYLFTVFFNKDAV